MSDRISRCRPRRVTSIVAVTCVLLVACTASVPERRLGERENAEPTTSLADRQLLAATQVALPPPGIRSGDLPDPRSAGAVNVSKYCTACHELPSPTTHSATDWPGVARRMWLRMDRIDSTFATPIPTAAERLVTLQYLIDNSLKVSGATLPSGPGRETFSTTCSRCHQLADPTQHSPADWVSVVRRMMGNMESMLGESMDPATLQEITLYLEEVSGGT